MMIGPVVENHVYLQGLASQANESIVFLQISR